MIKRIGVIYQDLNSLGFLRGMRARLKCDAELISPPPNIGVTQYLPRKGAQAAWRYFQKQRVDLIVRFTDADRDRWQKVRRQELSRFPGEARGIVVCGVAVNNVEDWLAIDRNHAAKKLGLPTGELAHALQRSDRIKGAINLRVSLEQKQSDVVERYVEGTPGEVFRRWLKDDALRSFYTDCRAAATREDCDTPNELHEPV